MRPQPPAKISQLSGETMPFPGADFPIAHKTLQPRKKRLKQLTKTDLKNSLDERIFGAVGAKKVTS